MDADLSQLASPRWGHFDLGTGYHGDLWLDLDGLFLWPGRLQPYARRLGEHLRPYQPAAVCGPLAGGAFLAQLVAGALGAAFLPAYPAAQGTAQPAADPAEGAAQPPGGFRIPGAVRDRIRGWRVAVVDDAVNAGTAVLATCQDIREAGAVPVAVGALLAVGRAPSVIGGTLGLPFHPAMTVSSQVWPAGECPLCRKGTPPSRPGGPRT